MKLEEFPEQTVVIAKDQPEYKPLPAYRYQNDTQGTIVCCWSLTWRERLHLLFTGRLWHSVLTFNMPLQPQRLQVEKPKMPTHDSSEYFDAKCSCGQPVVVQTNSKTTMRSDGKRVYYPDRPDGDYCVFRCERCGEPIHETCAEAAFPSDEEPPIATKGKYVLDANGEPVEETDLKKWSEWCETVESQPMDVASTSSAGVTVITVFTPIDYRRSYDEGVPLVWLTYVNGGAFNGETMRCGGSRADAKAMHEKMVAHVLSK